MMIRGCFYEVPQTTYNIDGSGEDIIAPILGYSDGTAVKDCWVGANRTYEGGGNPGAATFTLSKYTSGSTWWGPIQGRSRWAVSSCFSLATVNTTSGVTVADYGTVVKALSNKATFEANGFNFNYWRVTSGTDTSRVFAPGLISMGNDGTKYSYESGSTYATVGDFTTYTANSTESDSAFKSYIDAGYTVYKVNSRGTFWYMMKTISDNVDNNLDPKLVFAITADIEMGQWSYADYSMGAYTDYIGKALPSNTIIDGGFNATNGHSTVSGIKLRLDNSHFPVSTGTQYVGLFSILYGQVKNIIFDDCYLEYDHIRMQDDTNPNASSTVKVGFFGEIRNSGKVLDVEINADLYVYDLYYIGHTGSLYSGQLTGYTNLTTNSNDCINGAKISGNMYAYFESSVYTTRIMGAIGYNDGGGITQVTSLSNVYQMSGFSASTTSYRIGGCIGHKDDGNVRDCYYSGNIFKAGGSTSSTTNAIGLFAGYIWNSSTYPLKNCYAYAADIRIPVAGKKIHNFRKKPRSHAVGTG